MTAHNLPVPAAGDENRYTTVNGQVVATGWELSPVEAAALTPEPDGDGQVMVRPVTAEWLTHPVSRIETLGAFGRRAWHAYQFHMARLPLYLVRLVATAPWGVYRVVGGLYRWARDPDYALTLEAMKQDGVRGDATALTIRHKQAVRERLIALTAGTVVVWIALLVLAASRPDTLRLLALVAVPVLGWIGRPVRGVPVVERASYRSPGAPPFTEGLMIEALRTVLGAAKGKRDIQIVQPPARTRSGWEAIVRVPGSAGEVLKKKREFAGEIERPEPCVWLFTDPEQSANWLRVVVTRQSLRKVRMPDWPLMNAGPQDYFDMQTPIGVDPMGEAVTADKSFKSSAYAGMMGSGKSVSMINEVAAFVSDDRGEVHIYDFKGGVDWRPFAQVAHFYIAGSDLEDHERVLADLRELRARVKKRFKTLQSLPDDLVSPKTNSVLADLRHLDLHPILLVLDETQECFEFCDERKEYYDLIASIIKAGRAVGVTVAAGTQEINVKSLPISGICHWRHAHMVQDYTATNQILYTGASAAGHAAHELSAEDVGISYFGSGKEVGVLRNYYIDPDSGELDQLMERLAARRKAKGLLTGMAAGEIEPDLDLEGPLERVARVWNGSSDSAHLVELVSMLHDDRPSDYPKVTADNLKSDDVEKAVMVLSGQLSRHGIKAKSTRRRFLPGNETSINRQGVTWLQITEALETKQSAGRPDTADDSDLTSAAGEDDIDGVWLGDIDVFDPDDTDG